MLERIRAMLDAERRLRRAEPLALEAEGQARRLNGLPAREAEGADDLAALLESTCRLLERAPGERAVAHEPAAAPAPPEPSPARPEPPPPAPDNPEPEPEPSATARDLIELRDQLLASAGPGAGSNGPLGSAYIRLGQVLERREGLASIEDTGEALDPARQRVASIRSTSEPAQDGLVCGTLRPGYTFDGAVYRQQEVSLHRFEEAP